MKAFRYIRNGESLTLDAQVCTGCGLCLEVCPHAVFSLTVPAPAAVSASASSCATGADGAAGSVRIGRKAAIVDRELCMECGACAKNCPAGAIAVRSGVGCAAAIIIGKLRGTAPDCGCCCESTLSGKEGGKTAGKSAAARCCQDRVSGFPVPPG